MYTQGIYFLQSPFLFEFLSCKTPEFTSNGRREWEGRVSPQRPNDRSLPPMTCLEFSNERVSLAL